MINLSEGELAELKGSMGDLESAVKKIISVREQRPLLGPESILVRTLGDNYFSSADYEPAYFDSRRNAVVQTEFAEVIEALEIYDAGPTLDNGVELLLEVGDILYQKKVVELRHSGDENYGLVMNKFDDALSYIREELGARSLDYFSVESLAAIKYGTRLWMHSKGYPIKNKKLERELCIEAYKSYSSF